MINSKYFLSIIFLVFFSLSNAQDVKSFLLEIQNNDYMPVLDPRTELYKINSSVKDSKEINSQFSGLNMFDAIDINITDLDERLNLVFISIENTNNDKIYATLDYLVSKYDYYIKYTEIETYKSLAPPNDFENATSVYITDPNQYDLRMIRAEEAWDITTGDPNVVIGVADTGFHVPNDDLVTEIIGGVGNYETIAGYGPNHWNLGKHGTRVAGLASGATDNGTGSASIGYNTKMIAMRSSSTDALKQLSNMGAKVVNGSFGWSVNPINGIGNDTNQGNINDIIDNGTVVVAAAGNGPVGNNSAYLNGVYTNESYASRYYLPASYRDVISVSTVGDKNDIGSTSIDYYNWKGVHKLAIEAAFPNGTNYLNTNIPINEAFITAQHNDSVDIVVPAYKGTPTTLNNNVTNYNYGQSPNEAGIGTSFSAPVVAGTVGLMFSVNYCLTPKEVESILKLTALKIDNMPENVEFYGKLGAGMLDAYEAVKMSKDMADDFGTVEVKDRILYRWFYKLETAPYEIKMTNNDVTGKARLKFKARNSIEILSGDYYPETGGYIDLSIDSGLVLNGCPPPINYSSKTAKENIQKETQFKLFPNLVTTDLSIVAIGTSKQELINIKVYNFYGELVYEQLKVESKKAKLNLRSLKSGIFIVKVYNLNNEELQTSKIVKK